MAVHNCNNRMAMQSIYELNLVLHVCMFKGINNHDNKQQEKIIDFWFHRLRYPHINWSIEETNGIHFRCT